MWVTGRAHLPSEVRMWWGAPGNAARSLAGKATEAEPLPQLLLSLLRLSEHRQHWASPTSTERVQG